MLKVGLIGCGYMGTMHANCYKALADQVQVAAVADVHKEKAEEIAAMFGAEIYPDAQALIENAQVDYVDICSPPICMPNMPLPPCSMASTPLWKSPCAAPGKRRRIC